MNSCIPEENCSVQYHYIEKVMEMALALGKGIWGACMDIEFAFSNQSMHISELSLLAFSLNNNVFINSSLTFGAGSSCFIFEKVSCILQWVVTNETGCHWISHFLEDFPLLGRNYVSLLEFIQNFYDIMPDIGMPKAISKALGPTQLLEYLDLLDFNKHLLGISEAK